MQRKMNSVIKGCVPFLISMLLVITALNSVQAQELKRRISLGAGLGPLSPELAEQLQYEGNGGAYVNRVLPNSTSSNLGMAEGDILVKIADVKVEPGFFSRLKEKVQTGDDLVAKVFRKGEYLELEGKAVGASMEVSQNGEMMYDAVPYKGGLLRSFVIKPKKEGKHPAIFYIQGFSCASVEQNGGAGNSSIKQLLEGLVDKGYVVYRIEKLGLGDSQGTVQCADVEVGEEIEAFRAGLKALLAYDFVDADNVFLWGHSLGGYQAPYIAEGLPVKGIIGYGYTYKRWHDYLMDVVTEQTPILSESTHAEMQIALDSMRPALYDFFYNKPDMSELQEKFPEGSKSLLDFLGYNGKSLLGRNPSFLQSLNELNPLEIHQKIKVPTLAIYGGVDLAAIGGDRGLAILADAINKVAPGKGEFHLLPNTNHFLAKVSGMEENVQIHQAGQLMPHASKNFNPELVEVTHQWIQKVIKMD